MDSPLKWHGGKSYLAARYVSLMPPHLHRLEGYGGSLAFTLAADPKGVSECVNDINGELMNFWNVLREHELFLQFYRMCVATPFAEPIYDQACIADPSDSDVRRAWKFFVKCRQSMSGRMNGFAPLSRNRIRRGMNEQSSAWCGCIDFLPEVHRRLLPVVIFNKHCPTLIKQQDGKNTFGFYDPPYVHESRSTTKEYGENEMSNDGHIELLNCLSVIDGKFMLCGYDSAMYTDFEARFGWHRRAFDLPNNSASGATKERRTEIIWTNYALPKE